MTEGGNKHVEDIEGDEEMDEIENQVENTEDRNYNEQLCYLLLTVHNLLEYINLCQNVVVNDSIEFIR